MPKRIDELAKGTWVVSSAYTLGDIIDYLGSSYICVVNNTGDVPGVSDSWALLAEKGENIELQKTATHIQWRVTDGNWADLVLLSDLVGPTGPQGSQGSQGVAGKEVQMQVSGGYIQWKYDSDVSWTNLILVSSLVGPTGPQGSQGVPGIQWLGTWSAATAYVLRDVIYLLGSSYICTAPNTNQEPPNASYWNLVAQKGIDGEGAGDVVGPTGSTTNRVAVFDGITGKLIKDGGQTIAEIIASSIPIGYLDTDGSLAGNSDVKVASQKATKTYADTKIAKTANITSLNETGIADGEIAVFNLTNKDIRTSNVTIVTTLGTDNTTIPTSLAIKTVTDAKQATLVSGTNIKSINGNSLLGSGDLTLTAVSVTTKGDLQGFSTVPARLGVGADGYILVADSTQATGLRWAVPPSADSITTVAAPATDLSSTGVKVALTAGVNMAFGDVGYIGSDGKVALGKADVIAHASAVVMCVDATISANASGNFIFLGVARQDAWNWTVGGLIYLSVTGTTGNTLTQTAPSAADQVIQILGIATHADRMIFNPQLVQIERT